MNWRSKQIALISAFEDAEKCIRVYQSSNTRANAFIVFAHNNCFDAAVVAADIIAADRAKAKIKEENAGVKSALIFDLQLFSSDMPCTDTEVFERVNAREKGEYAAHVIENNLDARQIKIQKISLSAGKVSEAELVSYGMNKLTRRLYKEAAGLGAVQVFNKGMSIIYNNIIDGKMVSSPFTDEIIELNLVDVSAHLADQISKNNILLQISPDGRMFAWVKGRHNAMSVLRIGEPDGRVYSANSKFGKEIKTLGGEFRVYGCLYAGPSNQRSRTCLLFKKHEGESQTVFLERAFGILNEVTGGLLSSIGEEAKKRGRLNRQKMFKLVSRVSLAMTPMTPTMSAKTFAYYNGVFNDSGHSDGQWFANADHIGDYFGLDTNSVRHVALQARIVDGIISKGMAIAMSADDLNVIIKEHARRHDIKPVHVSYTEFRNLRIAGKLNKQTVYIITVDGEEEAAAPSYFFDDNTMKAVGTTPDPEKGFVLNILAVRKPSKGYLNKQDLSCIQHLKGAEDLVRHLGNEYINLECNKIERMLSAECEPKDGVVNPDSYYPQLIADICPAYVAENPGLFEQNVKDLAQRLVKAVSNYKLPLGEDDQYKYMWSDVAEMICGSKLLHEHESVTCGSCKKIDGILTRNPRGDRKEFYSTKLISVKEYLERIDKLEVSDTLKGVIRRIVMNLPLGVIMVPASDLVKKCLGGADFDGDGCTLHLRKEFVKIQCQEPEGSSDIPVANLEPEYIDHFDIGVMEDLMMDGLYGRKNAKGERIAPMSIGQMSNHNALCQALLMAPVKTRKEVLENIELAMDKLGYKKSDTPYTRRFTNADVCITDDMVREFTEAFYNSDRSVESFTNALDDSVRAGSSVLGRLIDINKTGEHVTVGFLMVLEGRGLDGTLITKRDERGGYTFVERLHTYYCEDTIKYQAVFTMEDDGTTSFDVIKENKDSEYRTGIPSLLTPVRDELMCAIKDRVSVLTGKINGMKNNAYLLDQEDGGDWQKFVDLEDLKYISMAYNDLVGNEFLQTEQKNNIRKVIANMARSVFDRGATSFDRFAAMRKASVKEIPLGKDGQKMELHSSFQYALKEEYVNGVIATAIHEGYAVNKTVGYRAYVRNSATVIDGDEIIIQDGISLSDNGIVTDKNVTGKFQVVRRHNGFWLVQDVEKFFYVPDVETIGEKASRRNRYKSSYRAAYAEALKAATDAGKSVEESRTDAKEAAAAVKKIPLLSDTNDFVAVMRDDGKGSVYSGHLDMEDVKKFAVKDGKVFCKIETRYLDGQGRYNPDRDFGLKGLKYNPSDNKARWNVKFPSERNARTGRLIGSSTRMNNALNHNGVFINEIYQYKDNSKKNAVTTSILVGQFYDLTDQQFEKG